MNNPYFEVGLHKGEMDFGVSGAVCDLSYEEIRKLREMIVVGIGVCEDMWRSAQQRRHPAQEATDVTTKPVESEAGEK